MLTPRDILDNFINSFDIKADGRSNKFFKKVVENKEFYINIIQLYLEGNSCLKISKEVGLDAKYISTILGKFNVKCRKKLLDQETLNLMVIDRLDGMSLSKLSKKYSFSMDTIKRGLNNAGVDTSIKDSILKLDDRVIEDYKTQQLSEISKKYGVDKRVVKKYLISKGVKIRTLSESVSLNIKKNGVNFKGENIPYKSLKNDCELLANSTYELCRFLELEYDHSVIMYTKDVETIHYNNNRNTYTADIYIEYRCGKKVVEEVKPKWYLKYMNKTAELLEYCTKDEIAELLYISEKSVNKFLLSAMKFEEAYRYFLSKGIEYKIVTEDNINLQLIKTFKNK